MNTNRLAIRHWWFKLFCIVFLAGLFCGFFPHQWNLLLLISILFLFSGIVFRYSILFAASFFLLGVSLSSAPIETLDATQYIADDPITVSGYLDGFPDIRKKNTRTPFVIETLNGSHIDPIRVLLLTPPDATALDYGYAITVTGKIQIPRSFSGFNYKAYLARHGISSLFVAASADAITIEPDTLKGNGMIRYAKQSRNWLATNVSRHLPSPHDTIVMGVLLGVKNELPEHTLNSFKQSGLQHILVVSGFNVTVLLFFVLRGFKRFGRPISLILALCVLCFYAAMTGFDMPVVRASFMGAIVAISLAFGRFNEGTMGLLLSLVILGIFAPHTVASDVSLHLSSAATLGILTLFRPLEAKLQWISNMFELRTLLVTGICAQLAVSPVIGWYFEETQLIGLISNLFVEPLVPLSMAFGSIVALLGFLPSWMLWIVSIPAFLVTEAILWIATIFDAFDPVPVSQTFAAYLGICVFGYMILLTLLPIPWLTQKKLTAS